MIWLYRKLILASIRAQMQYKLNFLTTAATTGLIMVIDFLVLSAILQRFDQVKGWDIYEVGVLYGLASASMSLYRLIAPEIHDFERYIVYGDFDQLLTRPVSPLTLLLTRNIELARIGGIVQGIAILVISLYGLHQEGKNIVWLLAYVPVSLAVGTVILFSVGLATATIGFWTGQIKDLQTFTLYAPATAANYPISLYPGWLKLLFYTAIPVAFMNYMPMSYLLDKGGSWTALLMPLGMAAVVCWMALRFWKYGIHHYHSTGS
ncbi:ABC transporter permease [Brevibacillus migulae]|uniref:ABC transporter permease n=1 Tax=Brevibacillus migulae TaxID=1644114 RepID=UPI00106E607B|nr:ABC-2 family transporter protein [Brevibacillus migulae]